jgi:hypothetical protein
MVKGLELFMSRRKLRLRIDDLKDMRVKLVSTCCISHSHMARARARPRPRRTRTITSQSNLLPLRRRRLYRMRVASCAVPLIIGQRSAHTSKEEKLSLSRRL